jgi:hypothetical protein
MVRYPLGGSLSWQLQYLLGLKQLGHEVYFVEKYAYENSCYDPIKKVNSNDCSYGLSVVSELFQRFGLENNWCFVEWGDIYHGMSKARIESIFRRADLYLDTGAHGAWAEEASWTNLKVFIDVDPGYLQIKWLNNLNKGIPLPSFDRYYTIGWNIGRPENIIPTLDLGWQRVFNSVNTALFGRLPPPPAAPYSTIMNWKSYDSVEYRGSLYGQKDLEFEKFATLPAMVSPGIEMAVSGLTDEKAESISALGWYIKDAQEVTFSFDSFCNYIANCRGEFSVCKNVYVATNSGWFSDKSAAFLANGRPVVVQDTGLADCLPLGEGLFAVKNLDEARAAIDEIEGNYSFHSEKAYEIAIEYFESKKVLKKLLNELGL